MQRISRRMGPARRYSLLAVACGLSIGAALTPVGCGPPPTGPAPSAAVKPHAGKTLKVAVADPILGAEIRARARGWANRNGAKVAVETDKPPREVADADIRVVPQEGISGPASRGELAVVPEALSGNGRAFRWDTLFVPFQTSLVQWGGRPVAVPVAGDGLVCVYRADRFRDPAAADAFRARFRRDLAAPKTWEDAAEIAAAFHVPGKPSLPPLPADRTAALAPFHQMAACYDRPALATGNAEGAAAARSLSFYIDIEGGKFRPRSDAPAFAAAYSWFRDTAPYRPEAAGDPLAAIATGTAVVAVLSLREVAALPRDPKTGAISDAFGIAPVPGTRTYFDAEGRVQQAAGGRNAVPYLGGGGAFATVSKSSANADAAWDFLGDLAGVEGSAGTMGESGIGAGPTRESHLSAGTGDAIWQRYGFDRARTEDLAAAMRAYVGTGVANPAPPLRTPDAAEVNAIFETQLRRAASGRVGGAEAAKEAGRAWAAHDAGPDAERLKEWRRQSVGLE